MSNQAGRASSVRVIVRVRKDTSLKNDPCNLLSLDVANSVISVEKTSDARIPKTFRFDSVFGPDVSQEQLYTQAGIEEQVKAAAQGFHSTVFAYGQTGSGKTYTMEGFNYVSGGPLAHSGGNYNQSFSMRSPPAPYADFKGTPPEQLGVIPRVAETLFRELQQSSTGRRATVRCSFVQLYKEQAYDLLNPSPVVPTPGQVNQAKGNPVGLGSALRMRWSKADDFYLENLFKVECASSEEVLAAFKRGVATKVVAAHRMNDSSSRSHCLCTLYIDSAPLASPNEVISSRLTLVDLAGSERSAQTGATDGALRDESLAINKSLFTLRQVVLALSANSTQQQAPQVSSKSLAHALPGSGVGGCPPGTVCPAHVPYRDSKLTALLKNSLGGNTLTTMIACISPTNSALEENISTLEYAARAKHVTNQVTINEDPKTRVIRELRSEVAFLRSQLAALQGPDAAAALAIPAALPPLMPPADHALSPSPLPLQAASPRSSSALEMPTSPSRAGLPPRPPAQPRASAIKGDSSPASSPGSPSKIPGAPIAPSLLSGAGSMEQASAAKMPRSGSAEALAGQRSANHELGLPRSGSSDAIPAGSNGHTPSMQEGSSQVALPHVLQQREAVATLADFGSLEQVGAGPSLPEGESFTSVKVQLLRATHMDVGVLAHKLLDAVGLVQQLSAANQELRKAYDASAVAGEGCRAENEELMMENVQLRDKLSMLEGLAGIADPNPAPSLCKTGSGSPQSSSKAATPIMGSREDGLSSAKGGQQQQAPPGSAASGGSSTSSVGPALSQSSVLTASSSALIELQELRKENTLLHTRLQKAEAVAHTLVHNSSHAHGGIPSGLPSAVLFRRAPVSRAPVTQSLPTVSLPGSSDPLSSHLLPSNTQIMSTGLPLASSFQPASLLLPSSSHQPTHPAGSNSRTAPPHQLSFTGSMSSNSSSSLVGLGGAPSTEGRGSGGRASGGPGAGSSASSLGSAALSIDATGIGPAANQQQPQTGGTLAPLSHLSLVGVLQGPRLIGGPATSMNGTGAPGQQEEQQQQQQQPSISSSNGSSTAAVGQLHPQQQVAGAGGQQGPGQHHDLPSPTLAQITQQMSARSLTAGLRVSTTGQLLAPPAPKSNQKPASNNMNSLQRSGALLNLSVNPGRQQIGSTHSSSNPLGSGLYGGGSFTSLHGAGLSASFSTPGMAPGFGGQGVGAGVLSGGSLSTSGPMMMPPGVGQHNRQQNRLTRSSTPVEEGGSERLTPGASDRDSNGMVESAAQLVQLFQARNAMARMRMV